MADNIERLAVLIEANTKSYERAMTRLQQQTERAVGGASRSTQGLNSSLRSVENASSRAATAVQVSGQRMQRAMQVSNAHVANLGFQLNDIGQGLLMGQSPFQIMIQQGTQVAQVFGQSGVKSVGGALGLLKQSLASVLNPVSIATFAVIGLGGALINWLTRAKDETSALEKALTAHAELVRDLKSAYEDAAKGVRDYGEESAAVLETQLRAQNIALQREMRDLTGGDFARTIGSSLQGMREVAGAAAQEGFWSLSAAAGDFWRELAQGRGDVLAFREAVAQLARLEPENQALQDLAGNILDVTQELADAQLSLRDANTAMSAFGAAAAVVSGQVTAVAGTVDDLANALDSLRIRQARADFGQPQVNATAQAMDEALVARFGTTFQADARRISGQAGFGGLSDLVNYEPPSESSSSGAAEQVDKIQEAIDALNEERAALHRTNEEQRIYEALASAGIDANHARAPEIIAAVEALAAEEAALQRVTDLMETAESVTGDFLNTMLDGLLEGKTVIESLGDALEQLKRRLLQMALDAAIQRLFQGLSGVFSAPGIGNGQLLGALFGRAGGGTVMGGQPYMVGERGPELFVPHSAGIVRPVNDNMGGGTVVQIINNSGAQVRQEQGRAPDGRDLVRVVVGAVNQGIVGGDFNAAMASQFGARPRRASR